MLDKRHVLCLSLLCAGLVAPDLSATARDPRDIAAEVWQQQLDEHGIKTPATDAQWQSGSIEMRKVGANTARSEQCAILFKRADLAMADGDQQAWVKHMASAMRDRCDADALQQRLARAEQAEQSQAARRDQAVAAAARSGRPEVYSVNPNQSVARSLEPTRPGAAWADAAAALAGVLAERQNQNRAQAATSRSQSSSGMTDRVMADIFAETAGTVTVEEDVWADKYNEVRNASGQTFRKRVELDENLGGSFAGLPDEDGGGTNLPPVGGSGAGGLTANPAGCANPVRGADEACEGTYGKNAGDVCLCCTGGVFGIDQCFWGGGSKPGAVTHQLCRMESRFNYLCGADQAWITQVAQERNNIDHSSTFYGDTETRFKRDGVRDVRVTRTIDYQCGARPANVVAGPVNMQGARANPNITIRDTIRAAMRPALEACCRTIGASLDDKYDSDCVNAGF